MSANILVAMIGGLLAAYCAVVLAAVWLFPSLKSLRAISTSLSGARAENRTYGTVRAAGYLFLGLYIAASELGFPVLGYILFVPFVVFGLITIRHSFNQSNGPGGGSGGV